MLPHVVQPQLTRIEFWGSRRTLLQLKSRRFTFLSVSTLALVLNLLIFAQLARKFHPDTNPDKGAREKFVEIQEAYDVRVQHDNL